MWSAKGGVGLSVTAAAVALARSRSAGEALLVDLCGDQAAILGISEPAGPGLFDWLGSKADSSESIRRLAVDTADGLALLPPGEPGTWTVGRETQFIDALRALDVPVVFDCGQRRLVDQRSSSAEGSEPTGSSADSPVACRDRLVERLIYSGSSVLVISPCYLALRHAVAVLSKGSKGDGDPVGVSLRRTGPRSAAAQMDSLIVVSEPGRALDGSDVSAVTGIPVIATLERDPAVARCVDSGQFLYRPNRGLLRALADIR